MLGKAFLIVLICLISVAICMAQENSNDTKLLPVPVCLDGKAVYINRQGNVVLQTHFDYFSADPFSEGLARFKENDKYGFIDETGKIVIKPTFDSVVWFSEELARVYINNKSGFINKTGEIVVQPLYDNCRDFANGFAFVGIENGSDELGLPAYKVGFIDKTGKISIGKTENGQIGKFDDAGDFSEGLAAVKVGEKWGFVNENDETAIRFRFKKAKSFSDGLAPVTINGRKWGFIDKTGKFVIEPQFTDADSFSEGLAAISTNKLGFVTTGFIDKSGKIVFKTSDAFLAREFKAGIASITFAKANKGGFTGCLIDNTGKIIFQEDNAMFFALINGVAVVSKNDKISYVDNAGKYIWDAIERNKGISSKCNELSPYLKNKTQ